MSSSFEGVYEPGVVDPGIPVHNPTTPFWYSTPHPLANHRSPWPTGISDVVIIGSGISGTSLARTLLSKRPDLQVTLIDARSLCSGATARNGGHIKTMAYAVWEDRKRAFGADEAVRISNFEHSHLKAMADAILEESLDCDLVHTQGVDAYYDQDVFVKAVLALKDMHTHAPHLASKYKVFRDRTILEKYMNLSPRCVGAIVVPAASVWPYKMITGMLAPMIRSGKLNVQTNTPVHAISDHDGADYATLHTSRGDVRARKIVHATNGWMGHLLPELRPFISPVRGNVLRYDKAKPRNKGGRLGKQSKKGSALGLDSKYSYWLRYASKDYDYLIQRTPGDVVVGRANTGRPATGDDSQTDLLPLAHLRGFPEETMASPTPGPSASISHAWSGILGFTQDAMPFVGPLNLFPGRSHQHVCGGYHGIGMVKAFLSAQIAAQLVLGERPGEDFPKSMLVTDERLVQLKESVESSRPLSKL